MAEQGWQDKQNAYYGTEKNCFYSGVSLGSKAAWTWVGISGTNTGFGAHGNTVSQRLGLSTSGTSFFQWSYNGGISVAGEIYGGEAFVMNGISKSGLSLRTDTASQKIRIWAW